MKVVSRERLWRDEKGGLQRGTYPCTCYAKCPPRGPAPLPHQPPPPRSLRSLDAQSIRSLTVSSSLFNNFLSHPCNMFELAAWSITSPDSQNFTPLDSWASRLLNLRNLSPTIWCMHFLKGNLMRNPNNNGQKKWGRMKYKDFVTNCILILRKDNLFINWIDKDIHWCNSCKQARSSSGLDLCAFRLHIYRVAHKNGTVDTVNISGLALINNYLFSPCWIEYFPHYYHTKIIKFDWELFNLWVISYGLSFSGFARFSEFRARLKEKETLKLKCCCVK